MLEGYFLDLAWLLGALFFGVMLGSLTGLIPGFHVNNVALILLALSPALLDLGIPLASVAAIIVSSTASNRRSRRILGLVCSAVGKELYRSGPNNLQSYSQS